ncbi:hypothetical protein [Candidatus Synchoanobacter obligatus]|uniref:Major facilitator superfamily (MFS) profile domain-containing protein n=1 Tax=Candidatus Synchoanobacter obligatus TaxID=2919597 RepID=A0ABT1L642_9GAMM|nr:hypothetical protein [Candidatus Synchoanobacter obligatus]MCP8352338.1 hypothetical protein [Candidatus Synchoanobacter obligatus]
MNKKLTIAHENFLSAIFITVAGGVLLPMYPVSKTIFPAVLGVLLFLGSMLSSLLLTGWSQTKNKAVRSFLDIAFFAGYFSFGSFAGPLLANVTIESFGLLFASTFLIMFASTFLIMFYLQSR